MIDLAAALDLAFRAGITLAAVALAAIGVGVLLSGRVR